MTQIQLSPWPARSRRLRLNLRSISKTHNRQVQSNANKRANLSKSIILHHNKLSSLLSTAGRYNETVIKDIEEDDEYDDDDDEGQERHKYPREEDDEDCVRNGHNDTVDSLGKN
jgi:hypothetical protein